MSSLSGVTVRFVMFLNFYVLNYYFPQNDLLGYLIAIAQAIQI